MPTWVGSQGSIDQSARASAPVAGWLYASCAGGLPRGGSISQSYGRPPRSNGSGTLSTPPGTSLVGSSNLMYHLRMSNETKFWESVASTLSGGWLIESTADHDPDLMAKMRTHDVRIYAVDVSTGWMASAAMTPDGLRAIRSNMQAKLTSISGSDLMSAASAMVNYCATDAKSDKARRSEALAAAAGSLTLTRTFEVVSQQGNLSGHWLMLVYKAKDKSLISRPVYLRSRDGEGFMPPDAIEDTVKAVLKTDLTAKQTAVYDIIKKSGGLHVADCYQDQDLLKESSAELKDILQRVMRNKPGA